MSLYNIRKCNKIITEKCDFLCVLLYIWLSNIYLHKPIILEKEWEVQRHVLWVRDIFVRIRIQIRIRECVPLTYGSSSSSESCVFVSAKMPTKMIFFSKFFAYYLLVDGRIRIREAQNHTDPKDPDPDPQHWQSLTVLSVSSVLFGVYKKNNGKVTSGVSIHIPFHGKGFLDNV
jgi:hypothetical protein